MECNRRTLLTSAAGLGGIALFSRETVFAQPPSWVSKVSPAVIKSVIAAGKPFQTGTPTITNVLVFQNALSTFFANLAEAGALPAIQTELESSGLLQTPLSYEQLVALRQQAANIGFTTISDQAINNWYVSFPGTLAEVRSIIAAQGIGGIHADILAGFAGIANNPTDGPAPGGPIAHIPGARFKPVLSKWACGVGLQVTGIYAATWGVQLALGVIDVPLLAAGLTIWGAATAVVAFFC
jgi:hypothetical protein